MFHSLVSMNGDPMAIVNVTARNGKTYAVAYKDHGKVKNFSSAEESETDVYLTDFEYGDRCIASMTPIWLANHSDDPIKFRQSEDMACLEGLIYALSGALVSSTDGAIVYNT